MRSCILVLLCLLLVLPVQAGGEPRLQLGDLLGPDLSEGVKLAISKSGIIPNFGALIHGPLFQLGHRIELTATYEPQDGHHPDSIHLKDNYSEHDDKRRIKLEAKVTFDYDASLGMPLDVLKESIGLDFPDEGPQSGVPVLWYFPSAIVNNTRIYPLRDFTGQLPTWTNYTNAEGIATAYLHPIKDQMYGGTREVTESEIKVAARTTGKSIPTDLIGVAFGVAEMAFKTTEDKQTVRIERHIPTIWQGTVTIGRTINGSWNIGASGNVTQEDPARQIRNSATTLWEEKLEIHDVILGAGGHGGGSYRYTVTAESSEDLEGRHLMVCDNQLRTFSSSYHAEARGKGQETGAVELKMRVDPKTETYTVVVTTYGIGALAHGGSFSANGRWHSTSGTCEGVFSDAGETESLVKVPGLISDEFVLVPAADWPKFDPDAKNLTGSLTWEKQTRSDDGYISYNVITWMEWNLVRVFQTN